MSLRQLKDAINHHVSEKTTELLFNDMQAVPQCLMTVLLSDESPTKKF